eukprot:sb/3474201/
MEPIISGERRSNRYIGRVTNLFVQSFIVLATCSSYYKLKFSEQKRVANSVLIRYKGHYAYLNNTSCSQKIDVSVEVEHSESDSEEESMDTWSDSDEDCFQLTGQDQLLSISTPKSEYNTYYFQQYVLNIKYTRKYVFNTY